MSKNLEIYNVLKQPPKEALRTIQAGRLKGKTDINPQWRYRAMTEQFGVCGVGWKYEIVRTWNEPIADGQVFAFAEINLYIMSRSGENNVWSDAIPATGGSMLVSKESAGLHASDEGYKMAITDAIGTAMKMLGVAADIYAGLWDGCKYQDTPELQAPKETPKQKKELTSSQKLTAAIKKNEYTMDIIQAHMILKYKKDKSAELTEEEMAELTSDVINCQIPKGEEVTHGKHLS